MMMAPTSLEDKEEPVQPEARIAVELSENNSNEAQPEQISPELGQRVLKESASSSGGSVPELSGRPSDCYEQLKEIPIDDTEGKHSGGAKRRSNARFSNFDQTVASLGYLLCPPSLKQLYIPIAAFIVSFVLLGCAVGFREEIQHATTINAGLVLGSIGSLVMCSVVIGSYIWTSWYRRHMHILLLNMALCEFLLALSFVLEPVWNAAGAGVGPGLTCSWLSTLREYLIMCSTAWTICMALDLYLLMTDPFTSPRMNRRKYQFASHSLALIGAIVMAVFNAFDAPVAVGNFCWVGAKKEDENNASIGGNGVWIFIIAPVSVSMSANIYVTFISYGRFRDGLAATLKSRHELLREGFLTTITLILYSALLWGVYGGYWVSDSETSNEILGLLFAFLLSYRGSATFILWCLYKRPSTDPSKTKPVDDPRSSESGVSRTSIATTAALSTGSTRSNQETLGELDNENDDAVRPQMNLALLEELVFYTTQGIAKAVRMAPTQPSAPGGPAYTITLGPSPTSTASTNGCKFTDFRPASFLKIRRLFGIDDEAFLTSLTNCTMPKVSEGASGSFMFYSKDRSYIVKSLTVGESNFLHEILDAYVDYVSSNPETFLTRFLGSYCIVLYGKKAHFVVMENVFDIQHGISIHQRYDIKGSWVDRNAQKTKRGSEATCRNCNMTFRSGVGRNICPNRAGPHEPNVVLKDMDLTTKLRFGREEGKQLIKQLKRDSDFLCDLGIMDYSLLLGVIEVSYQVNQQNILTRDGSVFLPPIGASGSEASWGTPPMADRGRLKQSTMCLRTSEVVVGPGFYYIGLIDILQTWTFSKRLERFFKTYILRKDPDGLSALPPKAYRTRFHKKLDEIIHLGHNYAGTPKGANTRHEPARSPAYQRRTELLHAVVDLEEDSGNGSRAAPQGQVRESTCM
ncbi:TPA: hypothetical protein N0F65_007349 [Lagenidium giganteum]|uniref:PIPK domain-containing protein n=1 Tax=Lagenidium giganteum TaxID=4803 RepID=A0AAV2YLD5_9STRA|nr:TPA: hypothetical protein N0F65_007349 [Lagenidium giganteum]